MLPRTFGLLTTSLVTLAVATSPATASTTDEVAAGQSIAAQLQSGQATCRGLTSTQFEHLGEYAMQRAVGSPAAHKALDAHLNATMGAAHADQMHQLLGRTYAGCASGTAGGSGVGAGMGPGMMGGYGYGGLRNWGAMMRAPDWRWMYDGSWQHMTRGQWRALAQTMMGGDSSFTSDNGGWSPWAVVGVTLAGIALVAGAAVALVRRPWRRHGPRPHAA